MISVPTLYQEGVAFLRERLGDFSPQVLVILGTGLGALGSAVEHPICVPYHDIPHMKRSTAPDHRGQFLFGFLEGQRVAVMQGRLHTYEGYSYAEVTYPVRLARLLGAETMLITNAAGCVNASWNAGDLMVITDHIKLFGQSPLCGVNLPELGPRFPDMSHVYTPALQTLAAQVAAQHQILLRQGVYMFFPGPQYETPAEVRAARLLGADAVGMSTVPEAIVAAHSSMRVLGLTLLTNMAAGVLDTPLCEEEVIQAGGAAEPKFIALMRGILAQLS